MRNFTEQDYSQLKAELEVFKANAKTPINNDHISIGYPADNSECSNFANLIAAFFEKENIKVNLWDIALGDNLPDTDLYFEDAPDKSIMISIFPK